MDISCFNGQGVIKLLETLSKWIPIDMLFSPLKFLPAWVDRKIKDKENRAQLSFAKEEEQQKIALDTIKNYIKVAEEQTTAAIKTNKPIDWSQIPVNEELKKLLNLANGNAPSESSGQNMLTNINNAKQQNIGSVIETAIKYIAEQKEKVNKEEVDNGWMIRFLDNIQYCIDDEVRCLWAKVLAGETTSPNSFSLRTIDMLRNLSKEEAKTINAISAFVFESKESGNHFLIPDFEKFGIGTKGILLLKELGIIYSDRDLQLCVQNGLFYNHKQFFIEFSVNNNKKQPINILGLTRIGKEIYSLLDPQTNDEYLNLLVEKCRLSSKITISKIELLEHNQFKKITTESLK